MSERSIEALERRLALIEAKAEIERAMKSYCRSADRRNLDAFLDNFHPDSTHNHIQYFKGRRAVSLRALRRITTPSSPLTF